MRRIGDLERDLVMQVLDTQFTTSSGSEMTKRLEQGFGDRFGSRYAISFINGTATMHAALAAAGIGPGDEVIVPPLTMSSTSFAVLHAGAIPVFADIDPETWTMDPSSVRERLSERTKAIIPVAIYGLSPDLDPLMRLAEERGLFVLEDDAQCFLGTHKGRTVGTIGHASSFSFQSSKHMTSGEGGIVLTDDEELADAVRRFGSLGYAAVGAAAGKGKITKDGIQDPAYLRHVSVGFNYRMPELCAAVALGQLQHLDELVDARKKAARLYEEALAAAARGWLLPQAVPEGYVHSYWTWAIALSPDAPVGWHEFRRAYIESGGDPFYAAWQLTYLEPAVRGRKLADYQPQTFDAGLCPLAESLQPRLAQFKTDYWDTEDAKRAAQALFDTIEALGA